METLDGMINKLGEVFVEKGLITAAQLETALKAQLIYGGHLGTCFIELNMLDEETLGRTLSEISGFPYAPSNVFHDISEGTIRCLSAKFAEEYQAVPLRLTSKVLHVAMVEPRNLRAIDELSFASGYRIEPWISPELRIFQALEKYYGIPRRLRYIALCRALDQQSGKEDASASSEGAAGVTSPSSLPNPESTPPLAIGEPPSTTSGASTAPPEVLEAEAAYGYGKSWREIADELDTQAQPDPKKEGSPVGASSAPPPTDRKKSKKNRKEKHRHGSQQLAQPPSVGQTPGSSRAANAGSSPSSSVQAAASGARGPASGPGLPAGGNPSGQGPGQAHVGSVSSSAQSQASPRAASPSAGGPTASQGSVGQSGSAPRGPQGGGSGQAAGPVAPAQASAHGPASSAPGAHPSSAPAHGTSQAIAIPVSERLCRADTTRDIISTILDETARTTDRTLFFAINNETLSLWDSRGGRWADDVQPKAKFSVTEPLFGLLSGESHFRGPLPADKAFGTFYQSLSLSIPSEILLLPLYLNDRLVGIFYGDTCASGKTMAPTEAYLKLMRLVSYALNMVLLKQKIRAASQSREGAESPGAEVESKPTSGL